MIRDVTRTTVAMEQLSKHFFAETNSRTNSRAVSCGRESHGTRTRKLLRWRGPAAIVNDSPVLSSERAAHINKPATLRQ
jgi:hypothetical protein